MKKWTLVLGSFILMIFFQNCQQSDLQGASVEDSAPLLTDYRKTSASGFKVVQFSDHARGKSFELDVISGRAVVYRDDGGARDADLCLLEAERQEIQRLLAASEVCEPVLPTDHFANKQCTMIYKYPYASLVDGNHEVRLGEKTNGCDVPVDLCGAQSQALQDFVQHVVTNAGQRTCH